jgi:hypothetical protein
MKWIALLLCLVMSTEAEARRRHHYRHHHKVHKVISSIKSYTWPAKGIRLVPYQYATGTSIFEAYSGQVPVTFGVCNVNSME